MILRKIINQKLKEFEIEEFIKDSLKIVGLSHVKLQMTPLGEKIIIYTSRPGLIVGRKGQSIRKLTVTLKKRFNLENPQIEINEVENVNLDAAIVAERIANSLEKYGPMRFKAIGHKAIESVMGSGAFGIEILISGKIPSARAKRWRFYEGYLKKCGDTASTGVRTAYAAAQLKSGTVGIQVRIMPPELVLPDKITLIKDQQDSDAQKSSVASSSSQSSINSDSKAEDKQGSDEKVHKKPKRQRKAKPKDVSKDANQGSSVAEEPSTQTE